MRDHIEHGPDPALVALLAAEMARSLGEGKDLYAVAMDILRLLDQSAREIKAPQ